MAEPIRTCVGCRRTAPRGELVRLVVRDGHVVVDVGRILPGRGVHLHPQRACLELALRKRALTRGLKVPSASTADLAEHAAFPGGNGETQVTGISQ